MSRQLAHSETEELFAVCRRYAVHYYDVQIEFVDHLATLIEDIWEKEPNLDFELAKKQAVQTFGKSNFTYISQKKERELRKKYNRLLWKYVFEFYRWPKVIMTFVCTLGLFLLFQLVEQTSIIILTFALLLLVALPIYHFVIFPKYKIKLRPGKTFLLADHLKQVVQLYAFFFQLPNLAYQSFNWAGVENVQNNWLLLSFSFIMVFLCVILYAHLFYVPQQIRKHFFQLFPEFDK